MAANEFETTHWSIILSAGRSDSTHAREAAEKFCAAYWYPLYAFVRRQGHGPDDAQDLTQEFFARLLARRSLGQVDPAKGKFRSFLLAALKHFLANEWDRAQAEKRGGEHTFVSFDQQTAEERYGNEPAHEATPEKLFERRWALTLLEQVLARLREENDADGKSDLFDRLKATLTGEEDAATYAAMAAQLGMTEAAVKVAVHRLRQRYRELLRKEIARTVNSDGEVEEELRYLFAVLSG